ncbi:MAG: hypothetical protein ACP5NW_04340 [Candidatus Woesearchaeota archaeon]
MGLLNLFRKKTTDIPMIDSPNTVPVDIDGGNLPSDLPPIGGSMRGNSDDLLPPTPNGQQTATQQQYASQQQVAASRPLPSNTSNFDFSMPISDDEPLPQQLPSLNNLADPDEAVQDSEIIEPPAPILPQPQEQQGMMMTAGATEINPEDINNLFITDTDWKEPDLNNYDPYNEQLVDEPKAEDFAVQGLPAFNDISKTTQSESGAMAGPMVADMPISQPNEPFNEMPAGNTQNPVELFIRGKVYSRVFIELDQVSKTLSFLDSKVGNYDELLKKEEPLMSVAKEQVEYLYRKLNNIDKKIFVQ